MKKVFLSAGILFAMNTAHADIIKCVFTEPFWSTVYSTTQSTLTYQDHMENTTQVIKNVSLQIKGPGSFELVAKNGEALQKLTLNNNGSDGMSDNVYPYEVHDISNKIVGGCSSNYLKVDVK